MHTVEVATLCFSEPFLAEGLEELEETPGVRLRTLLLPDNLCKKYEPLNLYNNNKIKN